MRNLVRDTTEGLTRDIILAALARPGKRVRARLALAACEVMNVANRLAVTWGAACELLHNGTLVHDDLQDGDRLRSGRPTTWDHYGAAAAITAGDVMLILPVLAVSLLELDAATKWRLAEACHRAAINAAAGQTRDLTLGPDATLSWTEYERIARDKTGALLALPVTGAAIMAGKDTEAAQLSEPFIAAAIPYQILNDLADALQPPFHFSDIRSGRPNALSVLQRSQRARPDLTLDWNNDSVRAQVAMRLWKEGVASTALTLGNQKADEVMARCGPSDLSVLLCELLEELRLRFKEFHPVEGNVSKMGRVRLSA